MGDEYRSDERDLTDPGYRVNTTTQADVYELKWKHHIDDLQNVLGKDIQVCYNYADGTIGDWDELGIKVEECDCCPRLRALVTSNSQTDKCYGNNKGASCGYFP